MRQEPSRPKWRSAICALALAAFDASGGVAQSQRGSTPIPASVTPASLRAPATGSLEISWTGPAEPGDYLVMARPADGSETDQWRPVQKGNPLGLRVPGTPGEYEIRYVHGATGDVLARTRIVAEPVAATIETVASGISGDDAMIVFTGPRAEEDKIGFAYPGAPADAFALGAWAYADLGSPARLQFPVEPGIYDVRYLSGLEPRVLAARRVMVRAPQARLSAPEAAGAGSTAEVSVEGTGPGDSFVGVARPGSPPQDAIVGARVRITGPLLRIPVPGEAGAYEIRFVLEANGIYRILASAPLHVEPARAELIAPTVVQRRSRVSVVVNGPGGSADRITIARPNASDGEFIDFHDAGPARGAVTLRAPAKPGTYELRYLMRAPGSAEIVLARRVLQVE